ncbi:M20/M25/M40 family metallo-hydrolase [Desulfobotulus sp. H1]|uniref:M20/M25/M40 family metallo-hydrolase n=1 Tax=Desulfobotulus pelophilus TaxID=2823377 RepID=A0ABT3N912_9BACT|nr:M20/M25/M40 family metallo-hydrolase [Desulfobotulus pelophilus]MCW7753954.1 M20/M25/M40 family metallo-hydrolase [Desulfobotulus pelophilus]
METWKEKDFLSLLKPLMAACGPTGNEAPRRVVLGQRLASMGIPFTVDGAGNLEVIFSHKQKTAPVVMDAHMDVVGPGGGELQIEEERLCGPGVADNLAAVSFLIMLAAGVHSKRLLLNRPLRLLFSTGEEGEGNLKGIRHYLSRSDFLPHAFFCLDLGMESFSLSAVGCRRYRVSVRGPGGHSWEDWGQKNAISELIAFLQKAVDIADTPPGAVHRRLTSNIGTIGGGEGINAIARKARALFEFRSTDPLLLKTADRKLRTLAKKAALEIQIDPAGHRPAAIAVKPDFLSNILTEAAAETGFSIREKPISSNANASLEAGWPSATFGICRCGHIHRPDEFLLRKSLETGWRFLIRILIKADVLKGMA